MQYLLTPEEFKALNDRALKGDKAPDPKALQELCSMVADNVPVKDGWYKGKAWGCILTHSEEEWYCDECPAQKHCPYPYKNWSK